MDLLQPAHSTMEDQIVVAPPPCLHNSVIVMASPPGKCPLVMWQVKVKNEIHCCSKVLTLENHFEHYKHFSKYEMYCYNMLSIP